MEAAAFCLSKAHFFIERSILFHSVLHSLASFQKNISISNAKLFLSLVVFLCLSSFLQSPRLLQFSISIRGVARPVCPRLQNCPQRGGGQSEAFPLPVCALHSLSSVSHSASSPALKDAPPLFRAARHESGRLYEFLSVCFSPKG